MWSPMRNVKKSSAMTSCGMWWHHLWHHRASPESMQVDHTHVISYNVSFLSFLFQEGRTGRHMNAAEVLQSCNVTYTHTHARTHTHAPTRTRTRTRTHAHMYIYIFWSERVALCSFCAQAFKKAQTFLKACATCLLSLLSVCVRPLSCICEQRETSSEVSCGLSQTQESGPTQTLSNDRKHVVQASFKACATFVMVPMTIANFQVEALWQGSATFLTKGATTLFHNFF